MSMTALRATASGLRERIARTFAWAYGCYAWSVFAAVLLCFGSLILLTRRPSSARRIAKVGARLLFGLSAMPLRASGLDRLPQSPHVLLVNHASFLDGLALTALLPPSYAFAVRQEFKAQRLLCPLLHRLGTVVMTDPEPGRRPRNVDRLTVALRRGQNLVVFPEGGFDSRSGLKPFHSGAFAAAAQAKAALAVAGLRGTRQAMHLHSWLPRRTRITLLVGPALAAHANEKASIPELRAAASRAMSALAEESLT
jgi:1-acyl-sn-glycerol-3-phosphate acyltransferase